MKPIASILACLVLVMFLIGCVTQQQRQEADQALSYIALGTGIVPPPDMNVTTAWKAKMTFISLVNGFYVSGADKKDALEFIDSLSAKVATVKTVDGLILIHPAIPALEALRGYK
jgi:hypothetical protein